MTSLVALFDRKLQIFKNSPKWTIFGIFNELLSNQNVNVARFARNVEWDLFYDFQTLCVCNKDILACFFFTKVLKLRLDAVGAKNMREKSPQSLVKQMSTLTIITILSRYFA